MYTELLIQTMHSLNQLRIYGAVANWCHQFGLTGEEKGRASPHVQPEEVHFLVSPPTIAPGNRMRENVCEVSSAGQ